MALLYANCRDHVEHDDWHWSRDTHATSASYAWGCRFSHGSVYHLHESYEGRARAVRRFNA
jgi:hypothetical protein